MTLAAKSAPLLLAALAGALLFVPASEPVLAASAALGVVLLNEALARSGPLGRSAGFLCGWSFGIAANMVALWSLGALLGDFARLPPAVAWLVAALGWAAQGLPYGLAAAATELSVRAGTPRWLALPLALTFVIAWFPQLFPWQLGATQLGFLPWVQLADLGGQPLVSALLVFWASALHAALRGERARRAAASVALAALLLPLVYGVPRMRAIARQRARAPMLSVGVVQSNIGIEQKQREAHAQHVLCELRAMTRALERAGAALTVWGETAYPYPLPRTQKQAPRDVRAPLSEDVRGPVLMGLETYASAVDEHAAKYNSAWLVHRDGALGDRADKARLLPFGEYVPLWHELGWLRTRFPRPGFRSGAPSVVRTPWGKLGILICYEDLFADAAQSSVALGARALVNLTNDAWFGPGRAPHLHDLAARMRAIEQRRDLVRIVNTGVSSFTSASGRSLHRTQPFTRARFIAKVRLLDEATWFSRSGDWAAPLCALAWLASLVRPRPTRAG